MFSPTRTALYLAIGAMALSANEANAGCKIVSGSRICASWIVGSEICVVKASNLTPGQIDGAEGYCEVDQASPLVGTVLCAPDAAPPGGDCRHTYNGNGYGHTKNAGNPGHNGDCLQFPDVALPEDQYPFSDFSTFQTGIQVSKNGTQAQFSIELNPTGDGLCTTPGFTQFVGFTANRFKGYAEFCTGYGEGEEDSNFCASFTEICTLNGNGNSYSCEPYSD